MINVANSGVSFGNEGIYFGIEMFVDIFNDKNIPYNRLSSIFKSIGMDMIGEKKKQWAEAVVSSVESRLMLQRTMAKHIHPLGRGIECE